jgi:hypothetical protein
MSGGLFFLLLKCLVLHPFNNHGRCTTTTIANAGSAVLTVILFQHIDERVTILRAPLAPNGWPSATAPPCTFTLAASSFIRFEFSIPTTAKASFSSQ